MTLFDITSSYFLWAPFTFIIRLAMGYVIGHISYNYAGYGTGENGKFKYFLFNIIGISLATIIMIVGYYIAEIIITGSLYGPIQSIVPNLMQCVIGSIAIPISIFLKETLVNSKILVDM